MAQSRLLVVAALLGLQAGARADDTPAPTAVISTISPTITLSPTAYSPPNDEDDRDWTDDVGRCTHRAENAVLFPFCFLALGALTMYLTSRYAPDVPYTVIMLCEGFLVDWWASLSNSCPLNAMQDSLYQWSHIDGNLLLLVFLPALLFGDAMSMNAYQFFRAKWQCLLLAGPGVVFAALLTAVFSRWAMPYNWSFSLSMVQGAILASTDPVAIVAVLKSAGASETLGTGAPKLTGI